MADTLSSLPLVGTRDRGVVGAVLGGTWLPFDGLQFSKVVINTSCKLYVPMGMLMFTDPTNIISSKFSLLRGAPLRIVVGKSDTEVTAYNFSLFSHKVTHTSEGHIYLLYFTADESAYLTGIADSPTDGTSAEAIQAIATACSIAEVDLDKTADKQTWRPSFSKFCHFASQIAQRGFIDNSSCMLLAMDMLGRLRYKNVAGLDWNLAYVFNSGNPTIQATNVWSQSYFNNGGIYGDLGGVKATTISQDAVNDTDTTHKTVEAKRISNVMNQTTSERTAMGDKGQYIPAPISAGNTHDSSAQAAYQNRRLKNLLTTGVRVITRAYMPDVQVLDPIHYEVWDFTARQSDAKNTGNYIITNKTIVLDQKDMMYNECYELSRDGVTTDPQKLGA